MKKKLRILAAGDLHGDVGIAEKLSAKGKKAKVDLVILAGDIYGYQEGGKGILDPFVKAGQKVAFVPGNLDFDENVLELKDGKNIHGYYVSYGDVGIAGIGSGNWKLRLDEDDLKLVRWNLSKMKNKKKILVSHLHAEGTLAEFSGIPGDEVVRMTVEEFEPDLLIAAHIHEGEGIEDRIGRTRVVQVGRRGTILEI